MKTTTNIDLDTVRTVYDGPEGDLWELVMGEQIHVGGFASSMDLAERAGIAAGAKGVDFCCCNGAGMRFLVRFRGAASMHGVDATKTVVERGRARCEAEGFADKITFDLADACASGLPDQAFDFVWGEDAWCYVEDKERLVAEAVRVVRPEGTIAFTDWVEGSAGLTDEEAERFLSIRIDKPFTDNMLKVIQQPIEKLKTQVGNSKGIGIWIEKSHRLAALPFFADSAGL